MARNIKKLARMVGFEDRPAPLRSVGRSAWLAALTDPMTRVTVHERFVGTGVRLDGWSCVGRRVNADWLLLVIDGSVDLDTGGGRRRIESHGLVWLPAGTPHTMQWSRRLRFTEVYVRVAQDGANLTPARRVERWPAADELQPAFDRVADEMQLRGPHHDTRLRALLVALATSVWRLDRRVTARQEPPLSPGQQSRLLRYTREHSSHTLTPADLARQLKLSPNYFSRRFRATFGITPRVWLNRRRIDAARGLLEQTDLAVYQIADRLGYADVAQFSRQFSKVVGASPRRYRGRPEGTDRPA